MNPRMIRAELERLRELPEVDRGFKDKASGLRWANQIVPLLEFKPVYHANFMTALHELHAPLSQYGLVTRWQVMVSQVDRAIADLKYMEAGIFTSTESVKLPTPGGTYVDPRRLKELDSLKSAKFDLTKLVALLHELDICHQNHCYFAIAALVRAVLDHIPPILGCKDFSEVANNYGGGKSFKESISSLERSARNIANQHLHAQVRNSEVLPTIVQVDFSNDLDVLLAEIVRVMKP
jgi:hypothetical protein